MCPKKKSGQGVIKGEVRCSKSSSLPSRRGERGGTFQRSKKERNPCHELERGREKAQLCARKNALFFPRGQTVHVVIKRQKNEEQKGNSWHHAKKSPLKRAIIPLRKGYSRVGKTFVLKPNTLVRP